jgi:adenosylcobinamide-GDP ribazoletransferase
VPVTLSVAAVAAGVAYRPILGVGIVAGLAIAAGLTWHAVRRLGGITGDVLGALVEVTTAVCLLVTALS